MFFFITSVTHCTVAYTHSSTVHPSKQTTIVNFMEALIRLNNDWKQIHIWQLYAILIGNSHKLNSVSLYSLWFCCSNSVCMMWWYDSIWLRCDSTKNSCDAWCYRSEKKTDTYSNVSVKRTLFISEPYSIHVHPSSWYWLAAHPCKWRFELHSSQMHNINNIYSSSLMCRALENSHGQKSLFYSAMNYWVTHLTLHIYS